MVYYFSEGRTTSAFGPWPKYLLLSKRFNRLQITDGINPGLWQRRLINAWYTTILKSHYIYLYFQFIDHIHSFGSTSDNVFLPWFYYPWIHLPSNYCKASSFGKCTAYQGSPFYIWNCCNSFIYGAKFASLKLLPLVPGLPFESEQNYLIFLFYDNPWHSWK